MAGHYERNEEKDEGKEGVVHLEAFVLLHYYLLGESVCLV